MYPSQTLGLILMMFYLVGGGVMCYYVLDEQCTNMHKVLSVLSTVLIGIAMLIFRLMRGHRTRSVKYFHMLIHTVAIVIFIIGYIPSAGALYFDEVHKMPSYVIMCAVVLQYLMAVIVFTYLYDSPRMRLLFAPFHDIFGIWIFLCLVGCCLAANVDARVPGYPVHNLIFNVTAFFSFIIIVMVVLSPYFEWELVGYI